MLGRILAANLGKQTGDHVQLYGQDFEVVGIFESFSVYENGGVFMLLDELQRQMDRPGEVTGFMFTQPTSVPRRWRHPPQIEALDPHIAATPCAEFVGSLSQMKIARTMSWFTSTFAIIIGSIGVMNTMAMAVFEHRAEIASLRAIGWRKSHIAELILGESLCLALVGALVGIASGIGLTFLLTQWSKTSGFIQGNISPARSARACASPWRSRSSAPLTRPGAARLPIADTLHAG